MAKSKKHGLFKREENDNLINYLRDSSKKSLKFQKEKKLFKRKRAYGEGLGTDSRRWTRLPAISCGKEEISVTAADFRMGQPLR